MTERPEFLRGGPAMSRSLPDESAAALAVRWRLQRSLRALGLGASAIGVGLVLLAATMSAVPGFPIAVMAVGLLAVGTGVAMIVTVPRWFDWIAAPIRSIDEERRHMVELFERARLDALRDSLTGLGNQRAFEQELAVRTDLDRRTDGSVALVLIDLDDLKSVNDSQGHPAGDRLLSTMGRLIDGSIRRGEMAFRVGGDEFAILLPGVDQEAAHATARRLLAAALEGRTADLTFPSFSFSAGVASFPDPSGDGAQLRLHADAALYSAKRHGRTAVESFDPALHAVTGDDRSLLQLTSAVAEVVASHAMRPVYQAIFDVASGRPIAYEGLVRPDPSTGFTDASAMFTAAEAVGRTVELDLAAIEVVAAGAGTVPADSHLAINVSPRTIEAPDFSPMDVIAILARHGLASGQVVIEITEREPVSDIAKLQRNLEACQAVGFRTAIDDVGAGNAGLGLLSQIRFDIVKIDLSLVQRGLLGEVGESVLRALRGLADRWGATVVAEGVETPRHLEVVRALGLHAAQGYLLARPAEAMAAEPMNIDAIIERWQYAQRLEAMMRDEADPDAA
ncbi:MAG TPA: EAL domain-containing protein [Candidatus Limnocylindrales bacterium]|nr:EAL domain-containing protein [Candidatus Limnocylindrales bacterium]